MTHTQTLISKLRDTASRGISSWGDLQQEAADELETLMNAVAAEREACAKVAEHFGGFKDGYSCAAAIRARGEALAQPDQSTARYCKKIEELIAERDSLRAALEQPVQEQQQARVDVITVSLIREGINKHRARELADHFVNFTLTLPPPLPVQKPVLQKIEQYRMQMAGISTAAIGYWKEGDNIHPDYDTVALRDVAKLYAKYEMKAIEQALKEKNT